MPRRQLASSLLFACACARVQPTAASSEQPTTAASQPLVIPPEAELSPSGLGYIIERIGTGAPPRATDRVTVRYTMHDAHGKRLRATRDRDTETIEISALPPGWAEGMLLLRVGDHAKLWVPESLAYPLEASGPDGPLVIEVELVDVLRRDGSSSPSATLH